MPTSDATTPRRSSVLKVALAVVAFAVSAALVNALLTLALVPYGSKSQIVWTDYQAADELDCVVVGTSFALSGISPFVLDEELGTTSVNLATPSQLLDESFLAIKTAYEDHGVTRVVLSLSHSQVTRASAPNPGSGFMHQRAQVVSPRQRLDGTLYLLLDGGAISEPTSLNMLFPWVSNKVSESVGAIVTNARMKLDGTSLYDAAEINEKGWNYDGKGYGHYTKPMDFNGSKVQSFFSQDNPEDVGVEASRANVLDPDRARALDDLCAYCAEHGIELYAFAPPLPEFSIIEYGEAYFELGDQLRSRIESYGGHYVDMNLVGKDVFEVREEYFTDSQHLTIDGAQALTPAIAGLIRRAEAGEDIDALRMSQEEYLRSVDHISCVFVDTATEADGIHVQARAMAGTGVEVEYQYLLKVGDDWQVLEDWTRDDSYVFLPEGGKRGSYRLCVNARVVGSDTDYDRCRKFTALY